MPGAKSKYRDYSADQLVCDYELRQTEWALASEGWENTRRGLEATVRRFAQLYKHSPIGFVTFDQYARVLDINPAATSLLEITPAAAVGLSFSIFVADKTCREFLTHLRRTRNSAGAPVSTEMVLTTGSGKRVPAQVVSCPVPLDSGRIFETAILDMREEKAAAEEVERAREYAESIVSTIPYPILILDKQAQVVGTNYAFLRLFETTEERVVKWPVTHLSDIEWQTSGLDKILVNILETGKVIDDMVVRATTRRGATVILQMNVRRLPNKSTPEPYLLVALEDITRRKRTEEEREVLLEEVTQSRAVLEIRVNERTRELTKSYGQLRNLGEQLILAHESEQRRIARELHDQVGQDLTALKLVLNRGKSAPPEKAQEILKEAADVTEELLQTVRNICGTLRPQVLDDLGLVAGLEWHFKTFSARSGIKVHFEHDDLDSSRLSPIIQSAIFRVIQESLTNIARHAEAAEAHVTLGIRENRVEFSIRDTGCGFDPADALRRSSTGLSGMRERITLARGRFGVISAPGQGTTIQAEIPLAPSEDAPKSNGAIRRNDASKKGSGSD